MLAILWANEFAPNDGNHFTQYYGANEPVARQLVNRAISDWNRVVLDQNWDNDNNPATNSTFSLSIVATDLLGGRGSTGITAVTPSSAGITPKVPTAAAISLDDDGGGVNDFSGAGDGWFFDQTPLDDAEFTAIANSGETGNGPAFQGTFVDVSTPGLNSNDFYRTIAHEIGHALGIYLSSISSLDRLYSMTTEIGDDPNSTAPGDKLRTFNGSAGTVTFTTNGGGHIYEGNVNDAPSIVSHPNELLNPGRVMPVDPPPGTVSGETTRQFISDLDAQILSNAYGYSVVLPSTLNTAHVTLDSLTGTLLVQGGITSQGIAQNDAITIDTIGSDIRVRLYNTLAVNYATERVPASLVRRIVISAAGDSGIPFVASTVIAPVDIVYYVVSSNQDAVDSDATGNGFVDLDGIVPGQQVTIRAAIRDATAGGSIYVPRGRYKFELSGAGGIGQGDLDITQSITIIGAGAGETIIDANGLDRVFDVIGSGKTLTLDSLTVTGGVASGANLNGGGISVSSGAFLNVKNTAIVSNQTTGAGYGGAIYFDQNAGGSIVNSVITSNNSANIGGVFLAGASGGTVTVAGSIFTGNGPASPPTATPDADTGGRLFSSNGFNRLGRPDLAIGFNGPGDYIGNTTNQVVTGIADTYDASTDIVRKSLRDAINLVTTGQEIWIPAWEIMLTRGRNLSLLATDTPSTVGDLDISRSMKIMGAGAGLSIIDAGGDSGIADRVFEVTGSGQTLTLDSLTITGGRAPNDSMPAYLSHGGGIFVQDGASLNLVKSAIVDNKTTNSGSLGGGIFFTQHAAGSITNSVITKNKSAGYVAGVYLGGSTGTFGQVSVSGTIIAENVADLPAGSEWSDDVGAATAREFNSLGNNRIGLDNPVVGFDEPSDYMGHVDYIVTGIADTYDENPSNDDIVLSLRDAIDKANTTAGAQEIWLPAWNFLLTRERPNPIPAIETSIEHGDLEVKESLTIRGVGSTTSVAWRPGAAADKVFELWGDYNSNYEVDSGDYVTYRKQQGQSGSGLGADGDDNGVVDSLDYSIYTSHFGNTLTLLNVL